MADNLATLTQSLSAYNDQKISNMLRENDNSKNEDFYKKLVELKEEQKRTLEFMQELYNQKQVLKIGIEKSEKNFNELQTVNNNNNLNSNNNNNNFERNTISAYDSLNHYNVDSIRNYENTYNNMAESYAHQLSSLVSDSDIKTNLNYEKENYRDTKSMEECDICDDNHYGCSTTDTLNTFNKPPLPKNTIQQKDSNHERALQDIDDNLRKIERMWDSFNLNDYNYDSYTNIREKIYNTDLTDNDEYMPKITKFQPFSMTIRDEERARLKKKLEKERKEAEIQRMKIELKESRKPFKANPVPNHVYKPLYDELIDKEAMRARRLYLLSKEYLDKNVKPFNFTQPQRRHSFCAVDNNNNDDEKVEFVANPLPEFYFEDENLTEKMKEEELYRQIRKQIRSYELLQKSKLPRNMALQKMKRNLEIQRDELLNAPSNTKPKNHLKKKKSYDVPNYDELYKKFMHELETKKIEHQHHHAVACKPFSFIGRESKSKCVRHNTHQNRPKSASSLNNSMSRLRHSLSTVARHPMPIQINESHRLRETANRKKLDEMEINEARKEHIEKMKTLKAKRLQNQIASKIKEQDAKELNKSINRKTRQLKLDKQKQEALFNAELDLINKKIESQKFLFERVDEENARRRAEKRFQEALKNAGLTENDIDFKINEKVARPLSSKK